MDIKREVEDAIFNKIKINFIDETIFLSRDNYFKA